MKRLSFLLAIVASFAMVGTTLAAAALFSFGTGTVVVDGNSATIDNDANEFGGVQVRARSINNKLVGEVTASFTSTGDVTGGAPRIGLPIDNDGDRMWDYYATIDAANCGGTSGETTVVSTENPECRIYFLGAEAPAAATYANWDAFAAANPTHRIASKGDNSRAFIVADVEGSYAIENVDLQ